MAYTGFSSRPVSIANKKRDGDKLKIEARQTPHRLKKPTDEKLYQWAFSIGGESTGVELSEFYSEFDSVSA